MMNTDPIHIVFAGGGTAGHLFPGLAVAAQLAVRASPPRITFLGTGKPFEARFVEKAGFDYVALPSAPLAAGVRGVLRFFGENFSGYRAARRFLRRERASVAVGLGGYASVPACRAAASIDIPLVLLEQNAYPGKATRYLARHANSICAAFDEARNHLHEFGPVRVTGNPIRAGFRPRRHPRKPRPADASWQKRLVVLGGSGGARAINEFVPKALYKLRDELAGWQIVHQTGPRETAATVELYHRLTLNATVVPFVQNLPSVLRHADLAISRAGGTTLAELAATGVPAILLPYPYAADDHQRCNADVVAAAGAARVVDEREIYERLDDALLRVLDDLLADGTTRDAMSAAMFKLARPDATWQVATMVYELAERPVARYVA
jgi:UDP-N-acetylglucosamine--N-acetylmuramyl-(pentapeptide) pyrophosphoryl-undecaprenol N-acetylglucosamine transferase